MEVGKGIKSYKKVKRGGPFFFFFFCFSLLKTTEISFGSTKMGIFYQEKTFHAGKTIGKNYFAPQKNMPVTPLDLGPYAQNSWTRSKVRSVLSGNSL